MAQETINMVVLGSGGVGKSAITIRFIQDYFVEKYDPTIEDSYKKMMEMDGNQFMIEIMDTAVGGECTAMRDLHLKNGEGFILVYSITSQSSFNNIADFHERIVRVKGNESFPTILVGNKCDLEDRRVVTTEQGEELAMKFICTFIEASALTNRNVDEIFQFLLRMIVYRGGGAWKGKPVENKKKKKKEEHACLIL